MEWLPSVTVNETVQSVTRLHVYGFLRSFIYTTNEIVVNPGFFSLYVNQDGPSSVHRVVVVHLKLLCKCRKTRGENQNRFSDHSPTNVFTR